MIKEVDKYSFNKTLQLIMKFYKEYKGEMINRIEAEELLKEVGNKTYCLIQDNEVLGVYVANENNPEVRMIKVFILDPIVRKKKLGYSLWEHMINYQSKPAIMCSAKNNNFVYELLSKRGISIGAYLSYENEPIECFSLQKGKR